MSLHHVPQTREVKSDFEYIDLNPPEAVWWQEAVAGMQRRPKSVPPKFFYDQAGSWLFERITQLPEYYLTRAETSLLQSKAAEIATALGSDCELVEFGCGNSAKIFYLLAALQRPRGYLAIDISREPLLELCAKVAATHPGLPVQGLRADFSDFLKLPRMKGRHERKVIFFPGSSIGNFDPEEAVKFLAHARETAGLGGSLLIGVDLKKDREILEPAYDDAQGVTGMFNKNLLARLNRECGANFKLEAFRHRAFYNEGAGRIEMHLESLLRQTIRIFDETLLFEPGETIHTENSYKYRVQEFQDLAARAGWTPERGWLDGARLFSVHLLR
ncbi:MAG TPA: L-histidine N(alpha)-methyltransferase, partial [bacterium]|nr:L-histidine N(alpha)-methyltransferase [bacterium]